MAERDDREAELARERRHAYARFLVELNAYIEVFLRPSEDINSAKAAFRAAKWEAYLLASNEVTSRLNDHSTILAECEAVRENRIDGDITSLFPRLREAERFLIYRMREDIAIASSVSFASFFRVGRIRRMKYASAYSPSGSVSGD